MYFWLFFSNLIPVFSAVNKYTFQQGSSVNTVLLYDGDNVDARSNFIFTHIDAQTLYVVEFKNDILLDKSEVLCTNVQTTKIIIGPAACVPEYGIEHRCTDTYSDALVLQQRFAELFSLREYSSLCRENQGDRKTCIGPLYVFKDGFHRPVPLTNETMLNSHGIVKLSSYGPGCGVPALTYLDIKRPTLTLSSTGCVDSFNNSFDGEYQYYRQDRIEQSDVVDVYEKQGTLQQLRILVRNLGGYLHVSLADSSGVNAYRTYHTSLNHFDALNYEEEFPFQFMGENCTWNLSVNSVSRVELNFPEILNGRNFYQNKIPPYYYVTRVCGFVICTLDVFGNLAIPGCPEGEYRGGYPDGGVLIGDIKVPVELPADESYEHYVIECDSFYPWGAKFRVFSVTGNTGNEISRQTRVLCRAPFYYPDAIVDSISPENEKALQCFNIGGTLAGTSKSYCQRDVKQRLCQKDYVYFNSWCYYKFDSIRDVSSAVPNDQASRVCRELGVDVEVLSSPDFDLSRWLTVVFIGWKRQDVSVDHRVLIKGNQCICYNALVSDQLATVRYCSCQDNLFPICRYRKESRPIPHEFVSMSPEAVQLFQRGNEGIPWTGAPLTCTCVLGSTGDWCNIGKCISILDIESLSESTESSQFFSKCYFQNRGHCTAGDLNMCQCNDRQAPVASLNPTSVYYKFRDIPCACPNAGDDLLGSNGFQINEEIFEEQLAICGGISRGYCYMENSTLMSRCVPRYRFDLERRELEPAYNGRANEGRIAIKPADDFYLTSLVTEGYCNGRGIVCASGEMDENVLFDGQDVSYFYRLDCVDGQDGSLFSGCRCFNGWTGDSCTCPIPVDRAIGYVETTNDNYESRIVLDNYVQIASVKVQPVRFFDAISDALCGVYRVFVGSISSPRQFECTFVPGNGWSTSDEWDCGFQRGSVVTAVTTEIIPECDIQVFTDRYPPGGNFTNPTAARFFANEYFRGNETYLEHQGLWYGSHGCTNTETMCDAEHSGTLCNITISSKRWNTEKQVFESRFCNEDTFPQLGRPLVKTDTISVVSKCDCLRGELFTFDMSVACQCISAFVPELNSFEMCYARGECRNPSFSYGMCDFDYEDFQNDPLSGSNSVSVLTRNTTLRHLVVSDSVFQINGVSWMFSAGSLVYVDSVTYDIEHCHHHVQYPVTITYLCGESYPYRVMADVLILLDEVTNMTVECDPGVEDVEGDSLACPVRVFCGDGVYPCIGGAIWKEIDDVDVVLDSGVYENSRVLCAYTNVNNTNIVSEDLYYILDPSNPVDRMVDDALGILTGTRVFNESISPYSNVLGEIYMFGDVIPGLYFSNEWSDDHYWFIASYFGNYRCSLDVYNNDVRAKILSSWITLSVINEELTVSNDSAYLSHYYFERGRENLLETGNGSLILQSLDTWPVLKNITEMQWYGLRDNVVLLPRIVSSEDEVLTKINIRIPVELDALVVYAESGEVCGMIMRPMQVGEVISFSCPSVLTPANSMLYIYDNGAALGKNITEIAQSMENRTVTQNFIWYSGNNVTLPVFQRSHISGSVYSKQASEFLDFIRARVYDDKRLPVTDAFKDSCETKGGVASEITALTESNKQYLRDMYNVYLAPRRASHDWQCKTFSRNSGGGGKIVVGNKVWVPWRNGDTSYYPFMGIGDEGGCECFGERSRGYFDASLHCGACVAGLGPYSLKDWLETIRYQESLQDTYLELDGLPVVYSDFSLGNVQSFGEMMDSVACRLPWSSSTSRKSGLCGGYGYIDSVADTEVYSWETVVFKSSEDVLFFRRCSYLNWQDGGGVMSLLNDTSSVDVITYTNASNVFSIIRGRHFLDGDELFLQEECSENKCSFTNGLSVECGHLYMDLLRQYRHLDIPLSRGPFSFWLSFLF